MFEYVAVKKSFTMPTDGMWQKIRFGWSFSGWAQSVIWPTVAKKKNGYTLNVWNTNSYQNYSPDKLEVLFIDVERRKRLAVKRNVYTTGQFWWKALPGFFQQLETNTAMTTRQLSFFWKVKKKKIRYVWIWPFWCLRVSEAVHESAFCKTSRFGVAG